jgi:hypothetical protein
MAAPVINTTQSVLGYLQWQAFAFQPWASNSPTFWNASPLPPGLTLHVPTGKISGAATMPGVFVVALRAGNTDGVSDPVIFTFGIEPSGNVRPSGVLEVYIDLLTKLVSLNAQNFGDSNTKDKGPLFWTKRGDDLVFHITFLKGGVVADINLAALRFALKEVEPENILVDGHDWRKVGEGEQTAFRLHVKLDSPELTAALTNYEADAGTLFNALGEFEWIALNNYEPQVGPPFLRNTTRTFLVEVARDLIPDTL